MIAVGGAILASFTYVTAQIFGVGIITSRFLGIAFETGVFVGLAGILAGSFLAGSFLGGMLGGLGLRLYYLLGVKFFGMEKGFGISDISAGVFGLAAGFVTFVIVSLLTRAPDAQVGARVHDLRYPQAHVI